MIYWHFFHSALTITMSHVINIGYIYNISFCCACNDLTIELLVSFLPTWSTLNEGGPPYSWRYAGVTLPHFGCPFMIDLINVWPVFSCLVCSQWMFFCFYLFVLPTFSWRSWEGDHWIDITCSLRSSSCPQFGYFHSYCTTKQPNHWRYSHCFCHHCAVTLRIYALYTNISSLSKTFPP